MFHFSLATKITLPFVALFTALLAVLGVVFAREIFQEIETRVEREQTFVLTVASDARMPLNQSYLEMIAHGAYGDEPSAGNPKLIVLQERNAPVTTLDLQKPDEAGLLKALIEDV